MQGTHRTRTRAVVRALLAGALLCALAAGVRPPRASEAAPGGQFSMSPSNVYLDLGDAVSITLILNSGTDIHEVYFQLAYDPAVVQLIDAQGSQPGVQVLQGPFPDSASPGTMLQNTAAGGIITYQYVLPGADEDSGTGTVATAQFVAIGNGSAAFQWQTLQLVDAGGTPTAATGTVGTLLVGADTPTPGPTDTPTITPAPTNTAVATDTPTPGATSTPAETETAAATSTGVAATATASPAATNTAAPTSTPKITVVADSNQGKPPQSSAVDPAQSDRAGGLPSAGSAGGGISWWRWIFFLAALMFGIAGWFFTLAVYNGSKEVVLVDRFDKRRRRR
ncbi:MAG TPA: cohesin domain-containing protein [Dehalococcoidia bacterium]|nr:cohesin domain-containing protein [Dehalococcoidia bacterium]